MAFRGYLICCFYQETESDIGQFGIFQVFQIILHRRIQRRQRKIKPVSPFYGKKQRKNLGQQFYIILIDIEWDFGKACVNVAEYIELILFIV
jgi:hypothetical protein